MIRLSDFPKNVSEKTRNFRVEADYYGGSEPENFGFPSKPTRKSRPTMVIRLSVSRKPLSTKTRSFRVEADYYGDSEPENFGFPSKPSQNCVGQRRNLEDYYGDSEPENFGSTPALAAHQKELDSGRNFITPKSGFAVACPCERLKKERWYF